MTIEVHVQGSHCTFEEQTRGARAKNFFVLFQLHEKSLILTFVIKRVFFVVAGHLFVGSDGTHISTCNFALPHSLGMKFLGVVSTPQQTLRGILEE